MDSHKAGTVIRRKEPEAPIVLSPSEVANFVKSKVWKAIQQKATIEFYRADRMMEDPDRFASATGVGARAVISDFVMRLDTILEQEAEGKGPYCNTSRKD